VSRTVILTSNIHVMILLCVSDKLMGQDQKQEGGRNGKPKKEENRTAFEDGCQ